MILKQALIRSSRKRGQVKTDRQPDLLSQIALTTFQTVAEQFIDKKVREFKESSRTKQRQRLENSLVNYAYPLLADLPVVEINREWALRE